MKSVLRHFYSDSGVLHPLSWNYYVP